MQEGDCLQVRKRRELVSYQLGRRVPDFLTKSGREENWFLTRNQIVQYLTWNFLPQDLELQGKKLFFFFISQSMLFYYGNPSQQIHIYLAWHLTRLKFVK